MLSTSPYRILYCKTIQNPMRAGCAFVEMHGKDNRFTCNRDVMLCSHVKKFDSKCDMTTNHTFHFHHV